MDNLKNDLYFLEKIKQDLQFVVDNTSGLSQTEFNDNQLLIDSVMFRIIQIAENTSKLSDGFKRKYSDVPWVAIKGMRNKIVHNYGAVNLIIVYDTVINGIPSMLQSLKNL